MCINGHFLSVSVGVNSVLKCVEGRGGEGRVEGDCGDHKPQQADS